MIHIVRRLVEATLAPFDALPPTVALTLMGVVTGVVLLLAVRYTTPQRWVEIARNRMTSAIYETRLFLDDPRRVLIAQGRLIVWSLAYIGTMIPAFVVAALPLGLLYLHLDARFGLEPLPVGRDFVVRVDFADGESVAALKLGALPPGLSATAQPVRAPGLKRGFVRLRAERPGTFVLPLQVADAKVEKRIVAEAGTPISPARARGLDLLVSPTLEAPLEEAGPLSGITVAHEARTDTWLGMPWWLYWLLVATAAALGLKKPLGVAL